MRLTRDEVVGRLCQLQAKVCHELLGYDTPNDCFCFDRTMGGHPTDTFINSGEALRYIEEVVTLALANDKATAREWEVRFKERIKAKVRDLLEYQL